MHEIKGLSGYLTESLGVFDQSAQYACAAFRGFIGKYGATIVSGR
jgi:hypothetical protein